MSILIISATAPVCWREYRAYYKPERVAERKERERLYNLKQAELKKERERKALIFWTNAPIGGGRFKHEDRRRFERARATFFARR